MSKITSFTAANRFLSNFYPSRVELDGEEYPTVEHAYQAAKTLDIAERMTIAQILTAGAAKHFGKSVTMRPDWEVIKLAVMEDLLRQKLTNVTLAARLIATGDDELIEGKTWGDTFWGVCNGVGENHLGKLLMKIRSELNG